MLGVVLADVEVGVEGGEHLGGGGVGEGVTDEDSTQRPNYEEAGGRHQQRGPEHEEQEHASGGVEGRGV